MLLWVVVTSEWHNCCTTVFFRLVPIFKSKILSYQNIYSLLSAEWQKSRHNRPWEWVVPGLQVSSSAAQEMRHQLRTRTPNCEKHGAWHRAGDSCSCGRYAGEMGPFPKSWEALWFQRIRVLGCCQLWWCKKCCCFTLSPFCTLC